MSIAKRLNAKYGNSEAHMNADDRAVARLLASFGDGYVPPEEKVKKPRKPRTPKK